MRTRTLPSLPFIGALALALACGPSGSDDGASGESDGSGATDTGAATSGTASTSGAGSAASTSGTGSAASTSGAGSAASTNGTGSAASTTTGATSTAPTTTSADATGTASTATGASAATSDTTTSDATTSDATTAAEPPEPLVFSVMGDTPYSAADELLLQAQIATHNASSAARFMVHVGDLKTGSSGCFESVYADVSGWLAALAVPTFVLLGDNDWNDCDKGGVGPGPAEALALWKRYFAEFDDNWPGAFALERMAARPENLAFVLEDVLVIGITLPGGRIHDADEWAAFLRDGADWVDAQLAAHGGETYAMVLLAHANPNGSHDPFMARFLAAAEAWGKPVVFIHGDGHVWIDDVPWTAPNVRRIQVDAGGQADPLEVTVTPGEPAPFTFERDPLP